MCVCTLKLKRLEPISNFDFHKPTRILFGRGRMAGLKDQVPTAAKVLIVDGGGSTEQTGFLAQVREALAGRALVAFGGIEPNPRFGTALKAVERIGQKDIRFQVAVGGESLIDTAINATNEFFKDPGIKIRLGYYDIEDPDSAHIANTLKDRGMTAIGEHTAITLADTRRILEASL